MVVVMPSLLRCILLFPIQGRIDSTMEHVSRNTLVRIVYRGSWLPVFGVGRTLHLDQLISNDNMCEVKSSNAGIG